MASRLVSQLQSLASIPVAASRRPPPILGAFASMATDGGGCARKQLASPFACASQQQLCHVDSWTWPSQRVDTATRDGPRRIRLASWHLTYNCHGPAVLTMLASILQPQLVDGSFIGSRIASVSQQSTHDIRSHQSEASPCAANEAAGSRLVWKKGPATPSRTRLSRAPPDAECRPKTTLEAKSFCAKCATVLARASRPD